MSLFLPTYLIIYQRRIAETGSAKVIPMTQWQRLYLSFDSATDPPKGRGFIVKYGGAAYKPGRSNWSTRFCSVYTTLGWLCLPDHSANVGRTWEGFTGKGRSQPLMLFNVKRSAYRSLTGPAIRCFDHRSENKNDLQMSGYGARQINANATLNLHLATGWQNHGFQLFILWLYYRRSP